MCCESHHYPAQAGWLASSSIEADHPGVAPGMTHSHVHCVIPSIRGEGFHYICIYPKWSEGMGRRWEDWHVEQIGVKSVDNDNVFVYTSRCVEGIEHAVIDAFDEHPVYNAGGRWHITGCAPLPPGIKTMKDAVLGVFEGRIAIQPSEGLSLEEWMAEDRFRGDVQYNKYGAWPEFGTVLETAQT